MKAVIFTGGSGSHALQAGLKRLGCELTLLINAWDDGKSTGVCRSVLKTLGPSDIRKNHFHLWSLKESHRQPWVKPLFTRRVQWPIAELLKRSSDFLELLEIEDDLHCSFRHSFELFFEKAQEKSSSGLLSKELEDFCLVNILYAADFLRLGPRRAIKLWEQRLELSDCVILGSESPSYLRAQTRNGRILMSEAEIVDFNHAGDRVEEVFFDYQPELNPQCLAPLHEADIIFFAPGTWFSSLYPTLKIPGVGGAIQKSKARKYMIFNNSVDYDFQGWNVGEFVEKISRLVPLSDFTFVENLNSVSELQFASQFKTRHSHLGQSFHILEKGRHEARELADFIETLWSPPL